MGCCLWSRGGGRRVQGQGWRPRAQSAVSKSPRQRGREKLADRHGVEEVEAGTRWLSGERSHAKSMFTQHLRTENPAGWLPRRPGHRAPPMPARDASRLQARRRSPCRRRLAPASPLPAQTRAPNELSARNFNMLKMTAEPAFGSQRLMLQEPPRGEREREREADGAKGSGLRPPESPRPSSGAVLVTPGASKPEDKLAVPSPNLLPVYGGRSRPGGEERKCSRHPGLLTSVLGLVPSSRAASLTRAPWPPLA